MFTILAPILFYFISSPKKAEAIPYGALYHQLFIFNSFTFQITGGLCDLPRVRFHTTLPYLSSFHLKFNYRCNRRLGQSSG